MNIHPLSFKKIIFINAILFIILLITASIAISVGAVKVPIDTIIKILLFQDVEDKYKTIILQLRLPRILMAIFVGGALSISGVILQALLRNPLAEPYILGISSGGTLGAVIAMSFGFGLGIISIPLTAFAGALVVILIVYSAAEKHGRLESNRLLLTGIMIGAFFNSMILLIMLLKFKELKSALIWLMGNLSNTNSQSLLIIVPVVLVSFFVIYTRAKFYNLLSLGEETAESLGVEVEKFKKFSYFMASLITAFIVAFSGIIGFVGLVIPHLVRLIFGADHKILIPGSFLIGSIFLLIIDTISRTIAPPIEIPIGAITAIVGVPIFLILLLRQYKY